MTLDLNPTAAAPLQPALRDRAAERTDRGAVVRHLPSGHLALAALVALLAACGGGGGADGGTAAPVGAAPAPPANAPSLTNPFVAPNAVGEPAPQSSRAQDMVAWVSYYRRSVGLPVLASNPQLAAAASAHSNYLAVNNAYSEGHAETPGRAGYTGDTIPARVAAAGYPANRSLGEEINGGFAGRDAVEGLIDAPLHRLGLFASFDEAGAGVAAVPGPQSAIFTIDFGSAGTDAGVPASQVLAYPAPGQTDVPVVWTVRESPSPAADLDNTRIGYPITVQARGNARLALNSLALRGPAGETIGGRLIAAPSGSQAAALFLPLTPLAGASRYAVTAAGTLDGIPLALSWSFTTQAIAPLGLSSTASVLTAAVPVTVTLTGGAGRQRSLYAGAGFSIVAGAAVPSGLAFATAERTSRTTLTLTRNGTVCALPLLDCAVIVQASDELGGAPTTLRIAVQ